MYGSGLITKSPLGKNLLHHIIDAVDPSQPPEDFKEGKFVIFLGGGRASGKTTLNNHLFSCLHASGYKSEYIGKFGSFAFSDILDNPFMLRFRNMLGNKAHSSISAEQNNTLNNLLDKGLDIAFRQNSPIVIDYHMDDRKFVDKVLESAKQHGYETILLSPHVSAEKYFSRVSDRKMTTGRPFDHKSALATHKGFAENLDDYLKTFDLSILLSNDRDRQPLSPIAIATPTSLEILDEQAYRDVRKKSGINIHAKSPTELYYEPDEPAVEHDLHSEHGRVGDSNSQNSGSRENITHGEFTERLRRYFVSSQERSI